MSFAAAEEVVVYAITDSDVEKAGLIFSKAKLGSNIGVVHSTQRNFDIYYDLPALTLLDNRVSLKLTALEYLSKKGNSKFKESVVISSDLAETSYKVKHYKNAESVEEKHPLLGAVKRNERAQFLVDLDALTVSLPMQLREIVQVGLVTDRLSLTQNNIELAYIDLVQYNAQSIGETVEFSVVKITKTDAISNLNAEAKLQVLSEISTITDLLPIDTNKALVSDEDFEYALIYSELMDNIRFLSLKLRFPYLVNLFNSLFIGFFGLIVVLILLRQRRKNYKL